jgi:exopolysaccharide/PEP-CTERM locus tyrosine autokinase
MNKHSPLRTSGTLLERAAEIYDFGAALRSKSPSEGRTEPRPEPEPEPARAAEAPAEPARPVSRALARRQGPEAAVDKDSLAAAGFIVPDGPVSTLAEEFRIIKRQLLLGIAGRTDLAEEKRRSILVCSAQPDEGKTFCAINLALSLASEKDMEVLLVDGDFPKPEILSILGIEGGAGLVDAIADPALDPESLVIRTDVNGLSLLPAGRHVNDVTELLASKRTSEVLAALARNYPRRLVIFDSPPALMASQAGVLATHVGQLVMVVRADRTAESDLREAVGLLSGCDNLSLMLNGAGFAATGRRFGSYYGYGQ